MDEENEISGLRHREEVALQLKLSMMKGGLLDGRMASEVRRRLERERGRERG